MRENWGMNMKQHASSNEFDAAKIIFKALKGLDKQQQDQALRFACETLGLPVPAKPALVLNASPLSDRSKSGSPRKQRPSN